MGMESVHAWISARHWREWNPSMLTFLPGTEFPCSSSFLILAIIEMRNASLMVDNSKFPRAQPLK
eukprot:1158366-Pelagomonas_calceolata.AAC.3